MDIKCLVYEMLTESTGQALCDSGDAYGRHWEANQKRTIDDFINEPSVTLDFDVYENGKKRRANKLSELSYEISVFHYLTDDRDGGLELDDVCEEFNNKFDTMDDWDSDIYGVSKKAEKYINRRFDKVGDSFNTYNDDTNLSQVLQGTYLELNDDKYVLLQIHQGCDVRGGYTDAKLFKLPAGYMPIEDVFGSIVKPFDPNQLTIVPPIVRIDFDNSYDGTNLGYSDCEPGNSDTKYSQGDDVEFTDEDIVEAYLG